MTAEHVLGLYRDLEAEIREGRLYHRRQKRHKPLGLPPPVLVRVALGDIHLQGCEDRQRPPGLGESLASQQHLAHVGMLDDPHRLARSVRRAALQSFSRVRMH